jgi:eIF-2B alpha/beta/delta-like uncharacterized protein
MKTSLEKAVEDIKNVKIQGAKNIAIFSLKFLRTYCRKHGFGLKFEVVAWKLEEARPTAAVLHNCIEILKKKKKIKTINILLKQLEQSSKKIGKIGSRIVKKNYKIFSHCHSGEALSIIKQAWKEKKNISLITTETDPLEQGVKTAKELSKLGIPVTLVTDSASGHFMNDVDCVIVGADSIRKNGIVNKIGTYNLALAAKDRKKPFYVAGDMLKLDKRNKFIIEERPKKEVYNELIRPGRLNGIKIRNPAFDLVPWKFVTAVITEKGIKKPEQIVRMLK